MMQATAPVLISTRDMPQGARIETSDVELAQLPVHDALAHACASVDDIEGTRAQIDIAHGQIIYPTMVSTMPVVAEGQTVIDVRLADGQQGFAIGTHVALSSMLPCEGGEMERGTPPLCTLSEDAWIMSETHDEGLVAIAMPAQDAVDVLAAQTQTPLLASKAP